MVAMNVVETNGFEECGEDVFGLRLVKIEGVDPTSYVDPIYSEQPTIVFDRINLVSRKVFVEKYGLCNEGANPKRLKIGVHIEEADVEQLFGPCINRNGYR